ncbi:MAG: ABC transporter permease subunit [Synergistaceae bacterium]|nr:ABC transporter permease subunit [Synergistaceae bacterium]
MVNNNNTLTILKKELSRLFGDRKLVFSGIILQGLLVYVMYTLMGFFMGSLINVDEDYKSRVSVVNMPQSISEAITESGMPVDITDISESDIQAVKERITAEEADLLVIFPVGFDSTVAEYDLASSNGPAPNVEIWYDSSIIRSIQVFANVSEILRGYERSLTKKFDVNAADSDGFSYDLNVKGPEWSTTFMMSLIPMLLLIVIYQGCTVIAPESIAGEKERGTLGTILVTPAKRTHIALAKIVSITIFGVLGVIVSFIGLMLSLPNLMSAVSGASAVAIRYSAFEYLMIFIVIISTVLVMVSILSLLSAYSKSIKEANSYAAPLMFVSITCGLSSMFTGGVIKGFYYYLIPIFNSAQSLTAVFKQDFSALNIGMTVLANVVFSLICAGVLAKMFNSEKIVFEKI